MYVCVCVCVRACVRDSVSECVCVCVRARARVLSLKFLCVYFIQRDVHTLVGEIPRRRNARPLPSSLLLLLLPSRRSVTRRFETDLTPPPTSPSLPKVASVGVT